MAAPSQPILDAVLIAYQNALAGKTVMFGGNRYESHDIDKLSAEVTKWQRIVSDELRAQAGRSGLNIMTATFNDG